MPVFRIAHLPADAGAATGARPTALTPGAVPIRIHAGNELAFYTPEATCPREGGRRATPLGAHMLADA
jgi:hypothetical protein